MDKYKCEIHLDDGKVQEIEQDGFSCIFKYQPERSKREDINSKEALMNNPFIKESTECFIQNDDAVL